MRNKTFFDNLKKIEKKMFVMMVVIYGFTRTGVSWEIIIDYMDYIGKKINPYNQFL